MVPLENAQGDAGQSLRSIFGAVLLAAAFVIGLAGCATPSQLSSSDRKAIVNRTFVITGASSGFGQGVALRLASYGANVVLAARRTELLNEVARRVTAAGGTPLVVATD